MGNVGDSSAVGVVIAVMELGIGTVELGQTGGEVSADAIIDRDEAFCNTSGRGGGGHGTVGGGCATHACNEGFCCLFAFVFFFLFFFFSRIFEICTARKRGEGGLGRGEDD